MYGIVEGIEVLLIFLGMSTPIIIVGLIYYLKKRFEHKQIMAAIEKGTPLSELRAVTPAGPAWIKNLTAGIALLIIAVGLVCMRLVRGYDYDESFGFLFVAIILFALGVSRLIHSLLQRKAQRQIQAPDKINTAESQPLSAKADSLRHRGAK